MPSNSLLYFIKKIINIPSIKVINYHFITDDELLVEVENISSESVCTCCGNMSSNVHQNHWYRVRDIPMSDYNIFLNVNRRRFKCFHCGQVFSEELDFVKKRRTYTKRLAKKVVSEVLETDIVNTGKRNRISPAEIETLLKELESDLLSEKPQDLRRLGIDEISQLKGGKNYAAVLVDLDKRKPIALLEKRNKEVIAEYLISLGYEILEQIEEVSIDLWIPYKSVVEELLPNTQIVADRFHVMKQINEELDGQRKKEKREIKKIKNQKKREEKESVITHSKYPLLKKKEKLSKKEKEKLEEVKQILPELREMYEKKEELRDIFESKITGDEAFDKMIQWTLSSYKYFPKSCLEYV